MAAFPNTTGTIRQPVFGRYGAGFLGNSPGRADQRRGKYGNALAQKVRKRKRIDRDLAFIRGQQDDSESDSDGAKSRPRSREKKHSRGGGETHWLASIFNYIDAHPNLPNTLSFYAQMIINFVIAFVTIFGIYTFWSTVRSDVDKASNDAKLDVFAEMNRCATDFLANGCATNKLPALQAVCAEWDHCMNQDVNNIPRARVSAKTFAEIFNSFIEPISYKAMVRFPLASFPFLDLQFLNRGSQYHRFLLCSSSVSQSSSTIWHLEPSAPKINLKTHFSHQTPSKTFNGEFRRKHQVILKIWVMMPTRQVIVHIRLSWRVRHQEIEVRVRGKESGVEWNKWIF